MKTSPEDEGMFGGRSIRRGVFVGAKVFVCLLVLCGLVLPAAARTKSFNTASAKFSSLPAGAQSAVSASLGRDQQAYHATAVRKGFIVKNPQFNLQATFTRHGVRVESGKASWGMALAAFGTSGKLQPVPRAKPQANENRVEYRRGALTEWYVNGPAGLEQGFTIAKAPAGGANGNIELALRLTGNMRASVDAAKTGLILKGKQTSLRYSGLAARDAKGRKLRSWLEVRNGRLLVQVAAAGATYPLVVDPYIQSAKLVASDGQADNFLGLSVAISGDGSTVVAEDGGGSYAYVFTYSAPLWAQVAKLKPSDPSYGGLFPYFVSTQEVDVSNDGSVVVVGSPYAADSTGAAFVFVEPSTGGWSKASNPMPETALLFASDWEAESDDYLGFSVAVSADGKTVVAGAPGAASGYDLNNNPIPGGAAYVFEEPDGGWTGGSSQPQTETAKLVASDGQNGDSLGFSVSIGGVSADGSVAVVAGAPGIFALFSYSQIPQGSAYVFDEPETHWAGAATIPQDQTAKLKASDGKNSDYFGYSVAISGDGSTVVAGAPVAPVTTNTNNNPVAGPGAAYVFVKPSSGWTGTVSSPQPQTAELLASDGVQYDFLGSSVAVSGDGSTVAAGSSGFIGIVFNQVPDTGAVYVFTKPTSGDWADANTPQYETDKAVASDGTPSFNFLGLSTSMSADGLKLATGAPFVTVGQNTDQGAAYVFTGYVPFSSFNASKLRITLGPPSSFEFSSMFALGTESDGIDPLTEPVTLQIGSLSLTIPAGSFQPQNKTGYYVFSGVVDGFTINAKFEQTTFYNWTFKANGSSTNALSITNPVTVTLTIGNDSGTATETVPIN